MAIRSRRAWGVLPACRNSESRCSCPWTVWSSSGFSRSLLSMSGQYLRTISITTGAAEVRIVIALRFIAMWASCPIVPHATGAREGTTAGGGLARTNDGAGRAGPAPSDPEGGAQPHDIAGIALDADVC